MEKAKIIKEVTWDRLTNEFIILPPSLKWHYKVLLYFCPVANTLNWGNCTQIRFSEKPVRNQERQSNSAQVNISESTLSPQPFVDNLWFSKCPHPAQLLLIATSTSARHPPLKRWLDICAIICDSDNTTPSTKGVCLCVREISTQHAVQNKGFAQTSCTFSDLLRTYPSFRSQGQREQFWCPHLLLTLFCVFYCVILCFTWIEFCRQLSFVFFLKTTFSSEDCKTHSSTTLALSEDQTVYSSE